MTEESRLSYEKGDKFATEDGDIVEIIETKRKITSNSMMAWDYWLSTIGEDREGGLDENQIDKYTARGKWKLITSCNDHASTVWHDRQEKWVCPFCDL